jgi:hypothetical protein
MTNFEVEVLPELQLEIGLSPAQLHPLQGFVTWGSISKEIEATRK